MSTTQPIRDLEHVRALANYYENLGQSRNHRLILMGLHTALRISDMLCLRWQDVYDYEGKRVRETITVTEQKTGKKKIIALNSRISDVLNKYASSVAPHDFLFANPTTSKAITRSQAYRIIQSAGESLGLPERVSCHSLRKTFGYHAWKSGVSPAVIMDIYNHNSLAVTQRYLGVSQDDKNAVYLNMNFTDSHF